MKLTTKKIFGKIHLWLALASGLVIFIVALTGAIYVFSDDIINITESHFTRVEVKPGQPLPASELTAIALKERQRFLGDQQIPSWNWATLYLYGEKDRAVRFSSRHYKNPNQFVDIFINPYDGNILHTRDTYAHPFWDIVVDLHTSLMLGDVGLYIVEFATLIFVFMLISGIVLWWPKNKAASRQRFWFRWRQGMKWKRKNYDLHNILGFYASWIVLFMSITGLGWSFTWFHDAIYAALNSKVPAAQEFQFVTSPATADSAIAFIDKVYSQVKQWEPNASSYHLNFATEDNEPFILFVQQGKNWAPANEYHFHPETGNLLSEKLYDQLSAGEKYDQLAGDIHYGWIFGWPSKILTFLGCIVMASLPITGFYIWWGRKKNIPHLRNSGKVGESKKVLLLLI